MKRLFFIFINFSLFCGIIAAQSIRDKSALLKGDEARRLAKQCSRDSPKDFTDLWEPPIEDLRKMETKLSGISRLRAKCCIEGSNIAEPGKWYLQYAALVWRGKKVVYISAVGRQKPMENIMDKSSGKYKEIPNDMWKEFAIITCDGGNSWGVLYDPTTGKFFDLAINGVG